MNGEYDPAADDRCVPECTTEACGIIGRATQDLESNHVTRHVSVAGSVDVGEGAGTERSFNLVSIVHDGAHLKYRLPARARGGPRAPWIERKRLQKHALARLDALTLAPIEQLLEHGEAGHQVALEFRLRKLECERALVRIEPRRHSLEDLFRDEEPAA